MKTSVKILIVILIYSCQILPGYSNAASDTIIGMSRSDSLNLKYGTFNHLMDLEYGTTLKSDSHSSYYLKNRWVKESIAPAILLTSGFLTWGSRKSVRETRNRYVPDFAVPVDDYLQYAPGAAVLGLNIAGKKGLNNWKRATLNWGTSMLIMGTLVNSVKYSARVMRPDGSSRNSFPSGHTATAFTNATFLHREYGPVSPLYSIAGYASSSYVGASRSLNNRHWISDILVGAAIGIISTEAAYAIVDHFYKNRGDNYSKFTIHEEINKPSYFATRIGYSFELDDGLEPLGVESTIEGAYYWNKKWGVGAEVTFGNYPISDETLDAEDWDDMSHIVGTNPYVSMQSMGMLYLLAGPQYTKTIGSKLMFQAKVLTGMSVGINGKMKIHGSFEDKATGMMSESSLSIAKYRIQNSLAFGTGFSFTTMMTPRIGLSWFVDYKYARPYVEILYSETIFGDAVKTMNEAERSGINNISSGLRFTAFFD